MIEAEGEGQSQCYQCKKEGKFSLTWTSFLYRTEKDNYKHLYCLEHCGVRIDIWTHLMRGYIIKLCTLT